MGRRKEKRSRGLHLTRGLRTHRYHCIALRAFWEKEKKKEISDCVFIFSRGLRTHRYHCVALRALMKSQPSKPSQPSQPFLSIHFAFSTKE